MLQQTALTLIILRFPVKYRRSSTLLARAVTVGVALSAKLQYTGGRTAD